MCCLFAILVLVGPRAAILVWWLFDQIRWAAAFDTFIWPLLGFLFLPWTTLAWALCYAPVKGVTGFGWIIVLLGLITDLGTYGGSSQMRRSQAPA